MLDIDGVLSDYPDGPGPRRPFRFSALRALRWLLVRHPDLKIVFTTDRRLTDHDSEELNRMWREAGLPVEAVIDRTPDLSRQGHSVVRGMEIVHWLLTHGATRDNWAVVDDSVLGIRPVLGDARCVYTDPRTGLTMKDARRLAVILYTPPDNTIYPLRQDDSEL